jgi:hypothetical protein
LPSRRMLREGNFVFVRAFQSEGKGHEHGREVHHPVSDDQWGKPSCTQVDRHVNEDAGKKGEAPAESEPLVGYERNKTMLQSPHDSYQAVGNPAIAGKSNETRSKIALISKLLGDRPDGPPGQKGIENAPEGQVSTPRFSRRHWRLLGVIEEPTGERAAEKEERKNQHEARDALLGTGQRGKSSRRSRMRRFSRRVRKKRQARQPTSTRVPRRSTKGLRLSREKRYLAAKTRRQSWLG